EDGIRDDLVTGVQTCALPILIALVVVVTQRFKAAISGAGVALIASFYGHDHYQRDYDIELGHPWDNKAAWDRISPFYRVASITKIGRASCRERATLEAGAGG